MDRILPDLGNPSIKIGQRKLLLEKRIKEFPGESG
jgi:hypothetical protein